MSTKNKTDIQYIFKDQSRERLWVSLDIIIPVYNEESVLDILFKRLESVFTPENLKKYGIKTVRFLMIDDGSKDRTAEIICNYIAQGVPAVLYRFSRNFGHQNAICSGIENADADVVSIIDADLQDPPEVILEMLLKWRDGYDVIYGERKNRKENVFKVWSYWMFYRLLSFLSEISIPLDSGDFCLLDRKVVDAIRDLPEKLRFPRFLRAWVGYKQTGLQYERSSRAAGSPKYSFSKLYRLATDGVASASIRPLKISQVFSIFYLSLSLLLSIVCIFKLRSYQEANEIALWFLFCCMLIALGGFVQSFCIYILSAYIGRGYLELKKRPSYIIMEVVGNGDNSIKNEINKDSKSY
jgi:dolichol-phosphate mannosyltransferase